MRLALSFLIIFSIAHSCNKDNTNAGNTVEIYSLKTVQLVANKCQVDASGSTIEDTPFVRNQDIIKYHRASFEFQLTAEGIQKVTNLTARTPFAVTVNKQVVYYGFYMPPYLSSTCDHSITMDRNWSSNRILMRLGYPGSIQGIPIEDRRNDPLLLATLRSQNKLK